MEICFRQYPVLLWRLSNFSSSVRLHSFRVNNFEANRATSSFLCAFTAIYVYLTPVSHMMGTLLTPHCTSLLTYLTTCYESQSFGGSRIFNAPSGVTMTLPPNASIRLMAMFRARVSVVLVKTIAQVLT